MKKYASNHSIKPAPLIPRIVWLKLRTKLNRRFALAYAKVVRGQRPQKRITLKRRLRTFAAIRLSKIRKEVITKAKLRLGGATQTDKYKRKLVILLLKAQGIDWSGDKKLKRASSLRKFRWISFLGFRAWRDRYKKSRLLHSYMHFAMTMLPKAQITAKNNSRCPCAFILRINPTKLASKFEVSISTSTSQVWVKRPASNRSIVLVTQIIGSAKHITKVNLSVYGTISLKLASKIGGANEPKSFLTLRTNHSRRLHLYTKKRLKLRNTKKRHKYYRFLRKFIAFRRRADIVRKHRLWDPIKPLVIRFNRPHKLYNSGFITARRNLLRAAIEKQLISERLIAFYYALPVIDEPTTKLITSGDNLWLAQSSLKIRARFSKKQLKRVAKVTIDKNRRRSYLRNIVRGQFGWFAVEKFRRFKQFRKQFKRWFGRFRRIKKNRLFIQMLRSYFVNFTGFKETQLMHLWFPFRRGSDNYWGGTGSLVEKFSQSLLLVPTNFIFFLGLVPSQTAAKVLIQSGVLIINGTASANLNYHIKPGDLVQFSPTIWKYARRMFKYHRWERLKVQLSVISFIQVDWSLMIISLVRWPYNYELVPPNFLTERWVRYYIRQFPVRARKFQPVKINWKSTK